jgi:hypothetical protein
MIYLALWPHRTIVNTSTGFSPFQFVHRVESILPIEFEIPSLKLVVELLPNTTNLEECLIHLDQLDEKLLNATVSIKDVGCMG